MKFSTFLNENRSSLSQDEFIELFNKNCTKLKRPFVRGGKNKFDFAKVVRGESDTSRKSLTGSNILMDMADELLSKHGMSLRKKSLIFGTNDVDTSNFGNNKYYVFPYNSTKVTHLGKYMHDLNLVSPDDYIWPINAGLHNFMDDVLKKSGSTGTSIKDIITASKKHLYNDLEHLADDLDIEVDDLFDEWFKEMGFAESDPVKASTMNEVECWTEGPCLVINVDKYDEIEHLLK